MNRNRRYTIENIQEDVSDTLLDIGIGCDSLVILADDMIKVAEDLKKDIELLRMHMHTCQGLFRYYGLQHTLKRDDPHTTGIL